MKWFILSFTTLLCFPSDARNPLPEKLELQKCRYSEDMAIRKVKEYDDGWSRYKVSFIQFVEANIKAISQGGPSSATGYLEEAARKRKKFRKFSQELTRLGILLDKAIAKASKHCELENFNLDRLKRALENSKEGI